MQTHLRNAVFDAVMPTISWLGNAGLVWLLLTAVLLCIPKTRKLGFTLMVVLFMDVVVCNGVIKPLVARIRPYELNTAVKLIIAKPLDYSFPSGHAAASFAATSALYFRRSKLWIPAFLLALLISFSRLYLYVHYPSDVLAGIALGILLGYLAKLVTDVVFHETDKRKKRRAT